MNDDDEPIDEAYLARLGGFPARKSMRDVPYVFYDHLGDVMLTLTRYTSTTWVAQLGTDDGDWWPHDLERRRQVRGLLIALEIATPSALEVPHANA